MTFRVKKCLNRIKDLNYERNKTHHIGNPEYSYAITIQSTDRSTVSRIHNEVLEKYEKTGSVEKSIEWLLNESQYAHLLKSSALLYVLTP